MTTGSHAVHGGRGHGCRNSPIFNEYVKKIVSKMAQYFKDHEAVIGWQIDNEIYPVAVRDAIAIFA